MDDGNGDLVEPPAPAEYRALAERLLHVADRLEALHSDAIADLDNFNETLPAAVALGAMVERSITFLDRTLRAYAGIVQNAPHSILPPTQDPDLDLLLGAGEEIREWAAYVLDWLDAMATIPPDQLRATPQRPRAHAHLHLMRTPESDEGGESGEGGNRSE